MIDHRYVIEVITIDYDNRGHSKQLATNRIIAYNMSDRLKTNRSISLTSILDLVHLKHIQLIAALPTLNGTISK